MYIDPKDYNKGRYLGFWSILAFQAGFINSIGFLDCKRFVSHVTGFGSQVGIALGEGQYLLTLEMLGAPASFIAGAWFSGYLTVVRKSRGLIPRYDFVAIAIPLMLLVLVLSAVSGAFGASASKSIY